MRIFLWITMFFVCLCLQPHAAYADARNPLLVEGKQALFQRVITHPGVLATRTPGGVATESLPAFTPLYVYGKRNLDGVQWLEVSPSAKASTTLWIEARYSSPWDKSLTMLFADRMSRDPVFFFESRDALNALVSAENLPDRLATLKRIYAEGRGAEASLTAMEPADSAVPQKNFYLMPVFDYSEEYQDYNLRLLKIGCINPAKNNQQKQGGHSKKEKCRAGIVFIIDTTISMGPYIEQIKKFISSSYNALETSDISNHVSFGIVGFRNNTKHDSNIEYISRVFSPLTPVGNRNSLESTLQFLNEATVSTHSFDEDAFAGIKTAIDDLDWSQYEVKVAVLLTDAGAIRNTDPLSSTGMNEEEMAAFLARKGVRLVVTHLQTGAAKRHGLKTIIRQYEKLTRMDDANVKSTYVPIPAEDTSKATALLNRVAEALVGVVKKIITDVEKGRPIQKPVATAEATPEQEAARLASYIGYAAQLEFLGKQRNSQAPGML
ncbi:MAG: VWA domain-containing protein, partial [Desulfovibrionaceae bacterium]|nr:VWA domain-containing protein [Desulfovibrionaceae bacterium]